MALIFYSFAALVGTLIIVVALQRRQRAVMLPPGPPGDPFIGHLLRMPSTDSALVFHQWAKTYGPVMHLKILGRSMIILDSYQTALDLLDKRGVIYSDRPKFTLFELLGWTPDLGLLSYGTKAQSIQRQMHQSYLSRHKIADFKPMQTQEARTLVQNLLESPPKLYERFMSRFATGIITQIVAGRRITSNDDPYLKISQMIYEIMVNTGPPGGSPIDFFPVLQHLPPWFPGAAHMGVVRTGRSAIRELHEYPLRMVKEQQASAVVLFDSLIKLLFREDEEQVKGAAANMFAAGEMTTWTTLTVFVLAMVLHPEVQAKAQEEIDSVIGDIRLPEFRDREDLPFVEGILQETLRHSWIPAIPLGVPHCAREDDMYCGMLIPKGSLVFANIRAMGLDESVYSDPTSFRPERFLPRPAGAGEPRFSNIAFGFGRRICTGEHLADQSLWIAIASILATCTITNAVDKNGNIIVPKKTMSDGLRYSNAGDELLTYLLGHLEIPSLDICYACLRLTPLWYSINGPKLMAQVMHLKILGHPMIILDSYQAALDLLDKKGLIAYLLCFLCKKSTVHSRVENHPRVWTVRPGGVFETAVRSKTTGTYLGGAGRRISHSRKRLISSFSWSQSFSP
ncbi:O-methylsterigmatocystin oxidoreductase [Mycena sanguinolenta]|uniref:O-methylsterigmatocystin oxidoreductase n=1 Tax=Mycena sanguinolenta TaxID=230812 RepID=A0A8H6XM46_9AGAR|nr:O-methylsterigmatocystin oxidoreductase [Mycena sanguinolenta]